MAQNRLLPIAIPLIIFFLLEIFFYYPKMIYVVLVFINLFLFFAFWQFSKASTIDKKWWNFYILPSIMSSLVIVYSVFLTNKVIIQTLFFLNLIFVYLYLRYVYYYLLRPTAYEVFSIENISFFANFLTFFLLASIIYGLQSFLNLPIWLLIIAALIIMILIVYQIIWVNKIDFKAGLPYLLLSCFVLIELAWSISFLPFNYNIAGLILAICYYIIIGLVKNYLLNKLDNKKIKVYLYLGLISLFFIILTTSWL